MIRAGVVLSGCGVQDGSEIHEAVSILIALDRRGAQIVCMAPNEAQADVIDHMSGQKQSETRNILVEAARIARGKIRDIAEISINDIDVLLFPGGYGAVKNLCTFATAGADCRVNKHVQRLLLEMHRAGRPIGMACISPVLAARVFGDQQLQPRLTIGSDRSTAAAIRKMGGQHQNTGPTDVCIDQSNRLVTTPCYMNDVGPWTVYEGAEKMVEEVLRLAGDTASLIRSQMMSMPVRQ